MLLRRHICVPLREISLLADSELRWFFAYSLVVVLNVDVIMVYFFLKYPSLLLITENKRKNCPLIKLNRLNIAFQNTFVAICCKLSCGFVWKQLYTVGLKIRVSNYLYKVHVWGKCPRFFLHFISKSINPAILHGSWKTWQVN